MRLEQADEPCDEDDFTELLLDLATELEEDFAELLLDFAELLDEDFAKLLLDSTELPDVGISLDENNWVAELPEASGHSSTEFHCLSAHWKFSQGSGWNA